MKNLVILGAGTGGTVVANRMRRRLGRDWRVSVVDPDVDHLYQPGLLFLPFGGTDKLTHPRAHTLENGVRWINKGAERIETGRNGERLVRLDSGEHIPWDLLVLATGTRIRPDLLEGLSGPGWGRTAFDFYTLDGARALRGGLESFNGGRLVLNVAEMPIKCPVAPFEFLFLADEYFRRKKMRDRVELVYASPLDAVFTKPIAARTLGGLFESKGIRFVGEFLASRVNGEQRVLESYDGRTLEYDLLVSIPTHSGSAVIEDSGLGDELGFVKTERNSLRVKGLEGIYALGDATDLPSSKAGSVAHFEAHVLTDNLTREIGGGRAEAEFDGHANCFVETGFGRAMLIDFNYDVEPLPGHYPTPIGPLKLLGESRMNHWAKKAFPLIYWNALLPGRSLGPVRMSMRGKRRALRPKTA